MRRIRVSYLPYQLQTPPRYAHEMAKLIQIEKRQPKFVLNSQKTNSFFFFHLQTFSNQQGLKSMQKQLV